MLGAGALGVGIYGSIRARLAVFGGARLERALSEREMRVLEAIEVLTAAIRAADEGKRNVTGREGELFSRIGVVPLLDEIDAGLAAGVFDDLELRAWRCTNGEDQKGVLPNSNARRSRCWEATADR